MMNRCILLSIALLAGCAHESDVTSSSPTITFTISPAVIGDYKKTPLTKTQWVWRKMIAAVPIFETGTDMNQVRLELDNWSISVLKEWPEHLVVKKC